MIHQLSNCLGLDYTLENLNTSFHMQNYCDNIAQHNQQTIIRASLLIAHSISKQTISLQLRRRPSHPLAAAHEGMLTHYITDSVAHKRHLFRLIASEGSLKQSNCSITN